jgi:8-oxo-dGTP pyrophosphatase MutT (NUDIX family)
MQRQTNNNASEYILPSQSPYKNRQKMATLNNAPKEWRIISSKNVYDNYFINLYEDTLGINGKEKIYVRGIRKDYSTVVPFISSDEILIIKSYRHIVDSVKIEVPSGYIDEGESAKQAAIRELAEETGYSAEDVISIGSYTLDYSMFEQKGNLFIAYGLSKEQEQSLGMMEKIETETMKVKEIEKLLLEGKISNAASIVALYRAIAYHKKSR